MTDGIRSALAALGLAALGLGVALAPPGVRADESADVAATALPAPALDGATLYRERTCIACHGVDAKSPILPEYPKLAGQNPSYLAAQVRDIKSGARSNGNTAAMRGVLHLVSDPEIDAIAAYLSKLKP